MNVPFATPQSLAAGLLLASTTLSATQAAPVLQIQLFMHSEEPHVPDTPNFRDMTALAAGNASSTNSYVHWRNQLRTYGNMCADRGIKLNFQSDWNFLEGCWKWEIKTPISGIKSNTNNLTIIQYLESLGHEVDPHSHEGSGYTYADVAFLLTKCGGTDTRVAAGHRLDPTTFAALDYDHLTAAGGVAPGIYTSAQPDPANRAPNWFPVLLMGGASASHENDPHVSGIWRPASAASYLSKSSTNSGLPAVGGWSDDLRQVARLAADLASGAIAHDGKVWTANIATNHRDIVDDTFLQTEVRALLDTLKTWQDVGTIITNNYRHLLDNVWPSQFSGAQNLYSLPDDHASFSLNWQDFYFKEQSATALERLLDLHESLGVPVDVYFTTWQADIMADEHPDLMGRLVSSALVSPGYHLRAPKPYSDSFEWGALTGAGLTDAQRRDIIENYEGHRLDPWACTSYATAVPDASHTGGFARMTELFGYAPVSVGAAAAAAPVNLTSVVNDYFHDPDDTPGNGASGAKMLVRHSSYTNLNTRWNQPVSSGYDSDESFLYYRPEHYDWKLITLFDSSLPDYAPTQTLEGALTAARATASGGGRAPWFVGVKLHDNDLFSSQSAWSLVWPNVASATWNLGRLVSSLELSSSTQADRFAAYQTIVQEAASRSASRSLNVDNGLDIMSLQLHAMPRQVGLAKTKVDEEQPAGTTLTTLSGGGVVSGQAVRYSLVSGEGDTDNADFAIEGFDLRATRSLSYESKSARHFRIRWDWVDSQSSGTILATGERAMTLVLANVTTDDDDHDGVSEAEEAIVGTDPNSSSSVFDFTSINAAADGSVSLQFITVAGRTYTLESSTDLQVWAPDAGAVVTASTSGETVTLTDVAPADLRKFYRVVITLTP